MKRFVISLLFASFCMALPCASFAAGLCCQLSSGVQESLSGVAAPGSGELSVQFTYSFTRMNKIKEGNTFRSLDEAAAYLKPDGASYMSLPVTMDMVKDTMTAGYGFTPRAKAFVSVPYHRNTMDMTMSMGVMMGWMDMTMEPVSGPGDATVMGIYRLYTDREIRPTDALTVGLGVKTPTGSFTEKSSSGNFVHAHMQPGTGSWDPLFSLLYTKMADQFLIQADATYQLTGRNRQGYEYGDSLAVNVTGKYAVARKFNVAAGLTYLHVGKASDRDGKYYDPIMNESLIDDPANTGGDSLWVSPGVQIFPIENGMVDLKVQLPVREKVNGIQLVSGYRLLLGLSYSF